MIISTRTVLIGITVLLIATEAKRQSNSWRIAAAAIAILCVMILNNLLVRTQMWAWLPFLITYIVLKRYTKGNLEWYWLLICPISMIFWVNVHGSFILGLALPGIFFPGESISKLLKQPNALNWHQIGWIGCVGLLSGIAILVNPRFVGIIKYPLNLLTDPSQSTAN